MISDLWDLRVDKIVAELKEGRRGDGRKVDEMRKVEIINGISENADGSARVKLGETDVISGVKFTTGIPYPDSPGEGSISVGVDLLPIASPDFEFGPPNAESIELSRVVDRGIRESKAIDFKDLCLVDGELALIAFVDMYVLNHDGNMFDACGIAALSSLLQAKIPKIEGNKIVKGEYKGKLNLKFRPVLNTFAKIGNTVVSDPTLSEEKSMTSRFSVAVTEDDNITAFQKGLPGAFKIEEIDNAIEIALQNSKKVRKLL